LKRPGKRSVSNVSLFGEEFASIAVVAGFVVLYFRTVKDLKRERREGIELKKEVSELPWDSSKLGGSRKSPL
jgi:hypothetical protein